MCLLLIIMSETNNKLLFLFIKWYIYYLEKIKIKFVFMKRISTLFIGILLLSSQVVFSQQKKEENPFSISLDLVSRYVWRGADFGASPNVQPGIEYNKNGFTAGAWGAYAMSFNGYQESDLYLGYTFNDLVNVSLTDYFFQNGASNYFDYNKDTTSHIFEISVTYKGTKKLPLSILLATNVYGADAKKADGKNQYSTYAEVNYDFKYISLFAGANLTPVDLDKGETGFYGNYLGFVNMGIKATKKVKITDNYSLPVNFSIITNPQTEKIFFVAGLSF